MSAAASVPMETTANVIRIYLKPLSLEGEGRGEGEELCNNTTFAPHPTLSPMGRGIAMQALETFQRWSRGGRSHPANCARYAVSDSSNSHRV